jgi:hypothetical protein
VTKECWYTSVFVLQFAARFNPVGEVVGTSPASVIRTRREFVEELPKPPSKVPKKRFFQTAEE